MRKLIKYAIVIVNIVFAALYLLALLAAVVPADRFVWLSFLGLIFPLLVIAQIGFVIFWICSRKWWFLLSLSLLIVSHSAVNQVFTLPHTKHTAAGQPTIKILTYNISLFGGQKHFDDIIALIKQTDADIVCLQEFGFYNNSQLSQDKILAQLDQHYPYRHLWYKNQRQRFWWGVATFSKYPIVNKQKVTYPSAYNVSIYSDIVVGTDTVRVFNNHLESNKLTSRDMQRYKNRANHLNSDDIRSIAGHMSQKMSAAYRLRAVQARAVADVVAATPYSTVICGDFNDVTQSYTYHTLAKGMTDAVIDTRSGYNYTFHDNGLFVNIDHILADKHFTPLTADILHVNYSDHYPVIATIAKRK